MGRFLVTEPGREYLVRVPGSSTSKLNDEQLAEVLNWIIENFAGVSLPDSGYERFTASEIRPLRQQPLEEIEQYRLELLSLAGQTNRKE
ncbi:cytochrome c, class I [Luminiphilus syltensis NOR5-1B]|uniref:Cytochrome c, class I n=1 Tax=Luminiphilus syltensis NOR5-1B TaxID=565045 RepID=B8KT70_9GAMM|nr:cytochrome c, class I [Luminiphilus syltensis NOR5-1B]